MPFGDTWEFRSFIGTLRRGLRLITHRIRSGRFAWAHVAAMLTLAIAVGCRHPEGAAGPDRLALERGGRAYLAQCAVCHGPEGKGDGPLAASIVAERRRPPAVFDSARIAALGRAGVLQAMETGAHRREGSTMPLWGPHLGRPWMELIAGFVVRLPSLDEAGHDAVSRYLKSPEGTPSAGRGVYVIYCSSCHGAQGGGDGFFSPALALAPPRIRGDSLGAVDDAGLARFLSAGGAHAAKAPAVPGWLYTITPDDRAALVAYLRALPGTRADH